MAFPSAHVKYVRRPKSPANTLFSRKRVTISSFVYSFFVFLSSSKGIETIKLTVNVPFGCSVTVADSMRPAIR